jgi:hypothetical protein
LRYSITIAFALLIVTSVSAQDSLVNTFDSVLTVKKSRIDSLRQKVVSGLDSIDRINRSVSQTISTAGNVDMDSFRSDTVANGLNKYNALVEKERSKLQTRIDSLNKLRLPYGKYARKLDSLNQKNPLRKVDEANEKIAKAQTDIQGKINQPAEKLNGKINQLNSEAEGYGNLPSNMKAAELSKDVLPETQKLKLNSDVSLNQPNLTADRLSGDLKPDLNLDIDNKLKSLTNGQTVTDVASDISKVSGNLSDYSADVKSLTSGDLQNVKQLDKDALSKISNEPFKAAEGELSAANGKIESLKSLQDQGAFKKKIIEKSSEMVLQQIALYEGNITGAVHKLSKHQQRAGTIFSKVKGLPKRPRKEKKPPVIERFVPGTTLQVEKSSATWFIDFNPGIRYRIRSIFSAGIGWNQRIVFDKHFNFYKENGIYGLRSFYELTIFKGLAIRTDVERMNVFVPVSSAQKEIGTRKAVWSYAAGLKKEFSFSPGIIGNVQFMYNLYTPSGTSPYLNRFNIRFGFEFPLKKKS